MAVFLLNICKFHGCGQIFSTLSELIQHIEDSHIDYDPKTIERKELQQPPSLPLSYVLRFFTDAARRENPDLTRSDQLRTAEWLRKQKQRTQSPSMSSVRSNCNTPTGSELDEEDVVSESDSNDSWTTQEEFSSELILRMLSVNQAKEEKPYVCPVPGCTKRYKNVNGIKYHAKNGHRKDLRVKKNFKCHCGKSYKSASGLRAHTVSTHSHQLPGSLQHVTAKTSSHSTFSGGATASSIVVSVASGASAAPSEAVGSMPSIASIVSSITTVAAQQQASAAINLMGGATVAGLGSAAAAAGQVHQVFGKNTTLQAVGSRIVTSVAPTVITTMPMGAPLTAVSHVSAFPVTGISLAIPQRQ
ncbi:PREDICTED: juxtaposed with another zinc finger protein 1-like isoform X2 [Priapulus caudatus]|uniref:Juxtaposed with another zinc finger protein 1-like isoform X2 n=1 Tax=Priapulus caudatus TaxID=37621 RepID=A0ABM1EJ09_PRICU|nr:PREDICTED: juxtaposed with another zinc finger protein 1-like isoform X2 [Priapulus caudatus]